MEHLQKLCVREEELETEIRKTKTIFPCWRNGKKSYTEGGRVQCDVCGSFKGVHSKLYYREDKEGKGYLKRFTRCVECRSLEVTNNSTGEILKQEKKAKEDK